MGFLYVNSWSYFTMTDSTVWSAEEIGCLLIQF